MVQRRSRAQLRPWCVVGIVLVDGDTAAVKAMYEELGVREAYEAYEESSVASIRRALGGEGVAALAPARTVLEPLLDKLYKRSK